MQIHAMCVKVMALAVIASAFNTFERQVCSARVKMAADVWVRRQWRHYEKNIYCLCYYSLTKD